MKARTITVSDPDEKDPAIQEAARLLRAGQLVAFPTETVYGLGANALNPAATHKVFEAKGRPANNPLIVHVGDIDQAKQLVTEWPAQAQILAEAFWPGPLTLVLRKASIVPDIVTAGGNTVAVRIPAHPVALALIKACDCPLAAPSANRSNQLSPTTAEHVLRGMGDQILMILDGGPCEAGIESTVLNLTSPDPVILRPGVLTAGLLSEILGTKVNVFQVAKASTSKSGAHLSPGQLDIHYAPRTKMILAKPSELGNVVSNLLKQDKHLGIMVLNELAQTHLPSNQVEVISMPRNSRDYARQFYATLHNLDEQNLDYIVCELPPDTSDWAGIQDRLSRAGQTINDAKYT